MKINKSGVNPAATTSVNTRGADKGKKADQQASAQDIASSAKVNLSTNAQSVQKAKNIASEQTVDEAKVARLQKLIDEGKYRVDAQAVADRLVDKHLIMGDS